MKAVKLGPSLYSSLICNQGLKALGAFEIGLKKQDRGILTGGGVILRFAPPRNIPVYTLVYSTRNKKFVAFSWLAAIMCMTNSLSNRFYVSGRHNKCKHKWRSSEHSFFLWHSDQEKFLFFWSRKRTNPKAGLSDCVWAFFGECSVNSVSHALQNVIAFHYFQFRKQQQWGVSRTSYLLSPYFEVRCKVECSWKDAAHSTCYYRLWSIFHGIFLESRKEVCWKSFNCANCFVFF